MKHFQEGRGWIFSYIIWLYPLYLGCKFKKPSQSPNEEIRQDVWLLNPRTQGLAYIWQSWWLVCEQLLGKVCSNLQQLPFKATCPLNAYSTSTKETKKEMRKLSLFCSLQFRRPWFNSWFNWGVLCDHKKVHIEALIRLFLLVIASFPLLPHGSLGAFKNFLCTWKLRAAQATPLGRGRVKEGGRTYLNTGEMGISIGCPPVR